MKAITLWLPWASLVAKGYKGIETRSWATKYRGPIAIHAAASMPVWAKYLCMDFAIKLGIEGYTNSWLHELELGDGPFGKVVATANLADCIQVKHEDKFMNACKATLEDDRIIEGNEYYFGDYTPGRYAWILEDIKPFAEPVPAKGKQRLWNWDGGD